jgi:lysophospholipase L1-like esterase
VSVAVNAVLILTLIVAVIDSGPIGVVKAEMRSAIISTFSGWQLSVHSSFQPSPLYSRWTSIYDEVPIQPNDIVFAGDSQIAHIPWHEFFQNSRVKGRGISGDGVYGLQFRMPSIAEAQPAALILFIGGNDIYGGKSPSDVAQAYAAMLDEVHLISPGTHVVILSTTPMGASNPNAEAWETMRSAYDGSLRLVADEREYAEFVNIGAPLSRPDGFLDPAYSSDASHLNGSGYTVVSRVLAPIIDSAFASR